MEDKELDAMAEKLSAVRAEIGDSLQEHDLSMGEVISLLMSMLIEIALDTEMSPLKLVSAVAQGCQAYETINTVKEERENVQWLN
jgi:hypothetical protein